MEEVFRNIDEFKFGERVIANSIWTELPLRKEGLEKGNEYYVLDADKESRTLTLRWDRGGEPFTCGVEYVNKLE